MGSILRKNITNSYEGKKQNKSNNSGVRAKLTGK